LGEKEWRCKEIKQIYCNPSFLEDRLSRQPSREREEEREREREKKKERRKKRKRRRR
jgi:hypothetical protein